MTAERQGHDKRTRKREVLEPETGWANGAAAGQDLGADPPTTCPQPGDTACQPVGGDTISFLSPCSSLYL